MRIKLSDWVAVQMYKSDEYQGGNSHIHPHGEVLLPLNDLSNLFD